VDLLAPLDVAGASVLGLTVVRTHVLLQVQNFAQVADELQFGLIVDDSENVGAAVNLASNGARSWAWYAMVTPTSNGATVNVCDNRFYDVKAMRKIPGPDATFLAAFFNNSAASKTYRLVTRTLVKLP
jgi:hypothetical protein